MRKHYRIVKPLRFFAFVLILVFTLTFASMTILKLNQVAASSVDTYKQIEIQNGDTLWKIAENFCSDNMDIRDYVNEICETNDLSSKSLSPGEIIFVPIYKL